jgi:hypothetical protein
MNELSFKNLLLVMLAIKGRMARYEIDRFALRFFLEFKVPEFIKEFIDSGLMLECKDESQNVFFRITENGLDTIASIDLNLEFEKLKETDSKKDLIDAIKAKYVEKFES